MQYQKVSGLSPVAVYLFALLLHVFVPSETNASVELLDTVGPADYVTTRVRDDGALVVDFSRLNSALNISSIRIRKCLSAAENFRCETAAVTDSDTVVNVQDRNGLVITEPGLYFWEFSTFSLERNRSTIIWRQYFAVPHVVDDPGLLSSITTYTPVYSFYPSESYFPIAPSDFYALPMSLFGHTLTRPNRRRVDENASAAAYMKGHGTSDSGLFLTDEGLQSVPRGNRTNFPVYWYAEEQLNNDWLVTYVTFYSLDEKYVEFIGEQRSRFLPINILFPNAVETVIDALANSAGDLLNIPEGLDQLAQSGSHAMDRESVTLRFRQRTDQPSSSALMPSDVEVGEWFPVSVTYAAHLPSQRTEFLGDQKFGSALTSWENGRTTVSYPNYGRLQDATTPVGWRTNCLCSGWIPCSYARPWLLFHRSFCWRCF